jgi:hypothetical protein
MVFVINIASFLGLRCGVTEDFFHISQRKKWTSISLQYVPNVRVPRNPLHAAQQVEFYF